MSETIAARGQCLCGQVTIHAATMATEIGSCHCAMCRKWVGGPLLTVECGSEVSFEGEDNISIFDSSDWGERGFCSQCGSHLFYRLKPTGQYHMPTGLFGDDVPRRFTHQIFIDSKPDYYEFANRTHNLTGEEVFSQFAQEESGE